MFIYLFLRETEHEQGRGKQRERESIPSKLLTVSTEPGVGLDPVNPEMVTCAKIKSRDA